MPFSDKRFGGVGPSAVVSLADLREADTAATGHATRWIPEEDGDGFRKAGGQASGAVRATEGQTRGRARIVHGGVRDRGGRRIATAMGRDR